MTATRYPKLPPTAPMMGIVAPSGCIRADQPDARGIRQKAENLGFRCKIGHSVGQVYGYLSGDDALRAEDLQQMYADPEVDILWCAKGGYGTPRLLDRLDFSLFARTPKPLVGYSDITALHLALWQACRMPTVHGPMPCSDDLEGDTDPHSREALHRVLCNPAPLGALRNPPDTRPMEGWGGGSAEGVLLGGNLSMVVSLLGTKYLPDLTGAFLFLEDIGETTMRLDRMLNQLRLAGVLDRCAGFVLGGFTDCGIEYPGYGFESGEVLRQALLPLKKPVVAGVQAGHVKPALSLPLGLRVQVDGERGGVTYLESLYGPEHQ